MINATLFYGGVSNSMGDIFKDIDLPFSRLFVNETFPLMLHGMLWVDIPLFLVEISIVSCNLKNQRVRFLRRS